ncbi:MAG TPA: hypothetical protein VFB02_16595 [Bradyrhizobium sp.]|nr:hypothetical protein [Bradyrhizobium sp.]
MPIVDAANSDTLSILLGTSAAAKTDEAIIERPPLPGVVYRAFITHPSSPGPAVLAIAHRENGKVVVDFLRGGLINFETATLLWAYHIDAITSAESDEPAEAMLHAMAGVISLLQLEFMR